MVYLGYDRFIEKKLSFGRRVRVRGFIGIFFFFNRRISFIYLLVRYEGMCDSC